MDNKSQIQLFDSKEKNEWFWQNWAHCNKNELRHK
jgi:hypothetical protein